MKTPFYVIGLLAFSAIMLSPAFPQEYPSTKVVRERIEIKEKEKNLDRIIDLIEYNLKVDKILSNKEKQK